MATSYDQDEESKAQQILNFKAFYCSSEDASHSVSELTTTMARDSDNLVGW